MNGFLMYLVYFESGETLYNKKRVGNEMLGKTYSIQIFLGLM